MGRCLDHDQAESERWLIRLAADHLADDISIPVAARDVPGHFVARHGARQIAERAASVKAEILGLEREAGNLIRFIRQGAESPSVRAELRTVEEALDGLRLRLATLERAAPTLPPRVTPAWVQARLEDLDALVRQDPTRARVEIAKQLDGQLVMRPLPGAPGERRAEITVRVNADGLLGGQEAVSLYLPVVAGAGFEPATFGL